MMIDISASRLGEALATAEELDDTGVTLDVLAALAEEAATGDLVAQIASGYRDTPAHRAVIPFLRGLVDAIEHVADAPDRTATRDMGRAP